MKTKDFLKKHEACIDGARWALSIGDDMADVWDAMIEQGKHDWLLWTATRPEVFPGVLLSLDPEDYSILSPDGKRTVAHSLAGMGLLPHGHRLWGISVNGWSVAHEAAKRGNTEELRDFIEWGNSGANGDTVAHVLARAGGLPDDCPAWVWDLRNKDGRSVWDEAKTAAVARLSMAVDTADTIKWHSREAFLRMVDKAVGSVEAEAARIKRSAYAHFRSRADMLADLGFQ